ncbi:O-antigen ligase family protein [Thermodesulfobacteriota bacterium]
MNNYLQNTSRYLIYFLLIFTPLARGSVQLWAISAIELTTLLALSIFLIDKTLKGQWQWIKTPLDWPIVCLTALCLLSSVFSQHRQTSFWSFILLLNYLTIFYLTIYLFQTRAQLRTLIYIIIGVATFLAVFGLFKRFGVNPFPWWDYGDIRYIPYRLSSTYGNANHLAGYLEMAVPLLLGLFMLGYRKGTRLLLFYITMLILTALILSLSRSGWTSTLIGLIFMSVVLLRSKYFIYKKSVIGGIIGFVVLTLVILASTPVVERIRTLEEASEAPSLAGRARVWKGIIKEIKDYPLLGTGPGTFSTVFTQYQPAGQAVRYNYAHNDYLHFISETGVFLMPIIIWMIIALYRKGFKKIKNPSRLVRGTTLGAMAGITALLFHSIVDFNLHIPANAILFTILAVIAVSPIPKNESF